MPKIDTKFNFINLYKYSFVDRIFIRLQTRALGAKIERLWIILPALINASVDDKIGAMERAKAYLLENISPKNLALKVYDRTILRLLDYKNDNNLFIQDRQKMLEIITQDIQLFSLIERILGDSAQVEIFAEIIKKQFDESYALDGEGKMVLRFQELHL